MNYSIIITDPFKKEIKRLSKKYPSLKGDLQILQEELLNNPNAGINLGSGIRKMRMAIGSKGRVLGYEQKPFIRKKSVVPQIMLKKNELKVSQDVNSS